ncbi:MAG: ABC-F family ATP-binding cassette domain-containing protein [Bacteroidales bacterium]|nr:ABC-F family ATP-binding cassette domain-containing protein [Bacteroidales bacterium]
MISIEDLTVAYGGFVLLDSINFHIGEKDRIGLTGKNGAGKSTLMKIICGLQNPSSGRVEKPSSVSVGYLPQIMEHNRGRTVLEETMEAFAETAGLERKIEELTAELSERTDYDSPEYLELIERLGDLNDALNVSHNEPPEVQARKTLLGLGFKDEELGRNTETFSQGWNMRIELAKILLRSPDLLMLDEPTNHLDIESIEWLEGYLKDRKGALLLVSHDRKFLDTVTNRTVEIMLGHIHDYKVPYSKYLLLREERMEQQRAAYDNQQRMIEKTEEFINAFRYKPTKSNQVQSRIKALEKLDRVEIDPTDNITLTVKFPPAPRSGDVIFKAEGLCAGYPGKTVFTDANIEIRRAEKIALVGRNGEGKTTLMRIIAGELAPLGGEVFRGYNVDLGYFAQNQEDVLDKKETVFSTLDRVAVGDIRSKLRDLLAQFLFRGEDIDKRVSVLSGGERARLGMARLMLQSHNLLALDEPTNHMDIKSKDVLKQALQAYDGALVIVSHDRDFLDGLVDKVYEFRDGRVREHLGSVSDYLQRRKLESLQELERASAPQKVEQEQNVVRKQESYAKSREAQKLERRRQNRIKWLEAEIERLETAMKDIEKILQAPSPSDDIMELTRSYLELKRDLDARTDEWGSLID